MLLKVGRCISLIPGGTAHHKVPPAMLERPANCSPTCLQAEAVLEELYLYHGLGPGDLNEPCMKYIRDSPADVQVEVRAWCCCMPLSVPPALVTGWASRQLSPQPSPCASCVQTFLSSLVHS